MLKHFLILRDRDTIYKQMKNTVNFEISNTILIVSNPEIKMLINFIVHTNCVEERNMRRLEKLFYYVDLCKRLIAA